MPEEFKLPFEELPSMEPDIIRIKKITFNEELRNFKKGETIEITKPFLILVGTNGCGKSTILDIIRESMNIKDDSYLKQDKLSANVVVDKQEEKFSVKYHDFHAGDKKYSGVFGDDMMSQIQASKNSSGIGSLVQFHAKKMYEAENGLVILDEPCRGLALKQQLQMAGFLYKIHKLKTNQVIISTHSKYVMDLVDLHKDEVQLYSVEHKRNFTTTKEFIDEHLKD